MSKAIAVVSSIFVACGGNGLTFVTRNTSDVDPMGVPIFNPWSQR